VSRRKRPSPPRYHKTLRRQVTERDARRIFRDGEIVARDTHEFGSQQRTFVRLRYRGASYVAWMLPDLAHFELRNNRKRK
jgi:hypothetical protein